jgi:hypothetical protein
MSYDQLKERYKAQILYHMYVNTFRFIYIGTCIQCGLDTLLIYLFDLQDYSEHKQTVFSVYQYFLVCHLFLELCRRKQGSCLVYILYISECCISRIHVDRNLKYIFRVPTCIFICAFAFSALLL